MLRIPCPICGLRSAEEFAFGGEVPLDRAGTLDPVALDLDRAWMLDNVAGVSTERWFHQAGCRRWLTLRRDTITDRVVGPG